MFKSSTWGCSRGCLISLELELHSGSWCICSSFIFLVSGAYGYWVSILHNVKLMKSLHSLFTSVWWLLPFLVLSCNIAQTCSAMSCWSKCVLGAGRSSKLEMRSLSLRPLLSQETCVIFLRSNDGVKMAMAFWRRQVQCGGNCQSFELWMQVRRTESRTVLRRPSKNRSLGSKSLAYVFRCIDSFYTLIHEAVMKQHATAVLFSPSPCSSTDTHLACFVWSLSLPSSPS